MSGLGPEEFDREKAKRDALAPWDNKRGIDSIDRNGHSSLVKAEIEQVAAALGEKAIRWEKFALDKQVLPGETNLVVFRLRGHSWTVIVGDDLPSKELSQKLSTEAIDFVVTDTCGMIGYTIYERGECVEHFSGSEGGDGTEFESRIRTVNPKEYRDIWRFVENTFLLRDVFEPALDLEYFFRCEPAENEQAHLILPGSAPPVEGKRLCNPGIQIVFSDETVISKPEFERVDFIVTREAPGKSGRIFLR